MRCPRRGSNRMPKDGRSRGKQTRRRRDCKYRYTPDGNRRFYSSKVIDQALAMYAEGASAAATGGAMDINEATVLRRVEKKPFRPSGQWTWTVRSASPPGRISPRL